MAWASKQSWTIENSGNVDGTERFTTTSLGLNPGESCHIQVVGNSGGTTDSLIISVYATLDDSSENYDTVPVFQFLLDCTDGNDNDVSFVVSGLYRFRIGFVRDGSTDTIATTCNYRLDGISV
jgi:hypothetical protein